MRRGGAFPFSPSPPPSLLVRRGWQGGTSSKAGRIPKRAYLAFLLFFFSFFFAATLRASFRAVTLLTIDTDFGRIGKRRSRMFLSPASFFPLRPVGSVTRGGYKNAPPFSFLSGIVVLIPMLDRSFFFGRSSAQSAHNRAYKLSFGALAFLFFSGVFFPSEFRARH